jgi:broad specificity phosphatase PhoE
MPKLILIKHAAPQIDPTTPSANWQLSDAGRLAGEALADRIAAHKPVRIVTSVEPKAAETGAILARKLDVPTETIVDLHEHDRSNVPHLPTREFISLVELFFRKPLKLVLGKETAADALDRFAPVVEGLAAEATETIAVVAHGTVISLLLEDRCGLDPFQTWRAMGLPSYVVIDTGERDDWRVVERVDRI